MSTAAAMNPDLVLAESLAAKQREAKQIADRKAKYLDAASIALKVVYELAAKGDAACLEAVAKIDAIIGPIQPQGTAR